MVNVGEAKSILSSKWECSVGGGVSGNGGTLVGGAEGTAFDRKNGTASVFVCSSTGGDGANFRNGRTGGRLLLIRTAIQFKQNESLNFVHGSSDLRGKTAGGV